VKFISIGNFVEKLGGNHIVLNEGNKACLRIEDGVWFGSEKLLELLTPVEECVDG